MTSRALEQRRHERVERGARWVHARPGVELQGPHERCPRQGYNTGTYYRDTTCSLHSRDAHVLIRSVAVSPTLRAAGTGSRLATHALDQAHAAGARHAWLFSRRSGPFWIKLGFDPADREELARALQHARQVRLFITTGQLEREVAWSRPLNSVR
ncbi:MULTISPECIES: GNAT family N-acetyltransferase [unclassified Agromyces]|uniref:GNAT family N-acetyltransferase n=1 Tax=unclassified Agromyces TaxID=2639701 RepID=UPI003014BAC6